MRFPLTIAILMFVTAGLCSFGRSEETLDRILVVVNDEIITERDLQSTIEPVISQYRATMSGHALEAKVAEARKVYLEQLINERLIRSAAKRGNVTVDEEEVDEMMDEIRRKFPSQEAFGRVLADQGLSFKKLKERFRDQILNRRMVDLKVRSRLTLSPGEIRDYYDQHQDEFKGLDKVRVRQILIRIGEQRSEEEAQELLLSILEELDKDGDMTTLARLYSEAAEAAEGGDMGWVERGQLIEKIDRQIFQLSVGQYTPLIRSQLGYHIFKVEEKKDAETRSFEQVRNRVQSLLYRRKTSSRIEAWLKELRQNAYIARKT